MINNKKQFMKKFILVGSIVGTAVIATVSGCNALNNQNKTEENSSTTTVVSSTNFPTTPSTYTSETSSKDTTNNSNPIITTTETNKTTQTEISTTVPPTYTTTSTNEDSITEQTSTPKETSSSSVTETKQTTTSFKTTATVATTTPKTTTSTTQTTTVPPVYTSTTTEKVTFIPNSRREEIEINYFMKQNNTSSLTKNNINNFEDFITVSKKFQYDTSTKHESNGDVIFIYYVTYYDLEKNQYNSRNSIDGYLEKTLLMTLLNEEYMTDDMLEKLLSYYTYEELDGIASNIETIFYLDIINRRYYDYSKIVLNNEVRTLLINAQNACYTNDYKTLETLCNENVGKYNDVTDLLLLSYAYQHIEHLSLTTLISTIDLSAELIDKSDIYERSHPKTLVLE